MEFALHSKAVISGPKLKNLDHLTLDDLFEVASRIVLDEHQYKVNHIKSTVAMGIGSKLYLERWARDTLLSLIMRGK